MSLVDTATRRQIAVIEECVPQMVGHEVAASPDGRFAYLALYGNSGIGVPGVDGRFILVLDLQRRKVADRIDLGYALRPHCILCDQSTGLLYVTTEIHNSVTIVDPQTRRVVGSIPTGAEQSHMLVISHDGRFGYTANVGPGTVSVLDFARRKFITSIKIAPVTQRISISNDDRMVFTADQSAPRMAVIDTWRNDLACWIDLPSPGYGSASTPDGRFLLVTLIAADSLAVVDLRTLNVVRTIKVGVTPQAVLIRPDGKEAYVSSFNGHDVHAIDLTTWQTIATIDVGPKPDGMAWAGV